MGLAGGASIFAKIWQDHSAVLCHMPHPHTPNQAAKPMYHPCMSNGVLFDLHMIHKKMIA